VDLPCLDWLRTEWWF